MVIEIIHEVLTDIRRRRSHGECPDALYLQLDNTCKQNKNRFLIGFLGLLVYRDIFQEILVSFLPVGHTHEDVDQFFSVLGKGLKGRDSLDRKSLTANMLRSFKEKPFLKELSSAANISDFLKELLTNFVDIREYRQFKITAAFPHAGQIAFRASTHEAYRYLSRV